MVGVAKIHRRNARVFARHGTGESVACSSPSRSNDVCHEHAFASEILRSAIRQESNRGPLFAIGERNGAWVRGRVPTRLGPA